MITLDKSIKEFLATMFCLFLRSYIIDKDKHFIRHRKMDYIDHIKFIFWNKGRNNDIEATEFFRLFSDKKYETMSHQAIGKQRVFIRLELFIKLYKCFINKIYHEHKHFSEFKGYIIGACDGSIFDLPNVTLTRKEFNVGDKTIFENPRIRARVSGIMDVNSKLMLTTKIVERTVKETTLAMEHLNDLKNRLGVENLITIYDRGYNSIELMLFTENINSKFLIRLPKNAFISQRRIIMGSDKNINVNLTNSKIKKFDNDYLKEMAKEMGKYNLRIVEITLENGTKEILATNLSSEEFTTEDLKELYAQRWTIETGYKKLKSQIIIERFSGYRRILIEQDFYASIFLYNLATSIQWDGQQHINIKHRNNDEKFICKPVFSSIVGNMYIYMDDILSSKQKTINKTIEFLISRAKKMYYEKNEKYLEIMKNEKNTEDLKLQEKWGGEWEKHKPNRKQDDSTNKHPGNPKPTH